MTPSKQILIVEDEKDILELCSLHLRREGFTVTTAEDGEKSLKLLEKNSYDLTILDWMLPGLSGLDLCKKIRNSQNSELAKTPILMVTARAHTSDIVLGLEMGADDYITKPFEIPIFLARVRSLLRRSQLQKLGGESKQFEVLGLQMNIDTHQVYCKKQEVELTPSEFKLLEALLLNQGRVLTREKLIDYVQGEDVNVTDRTIDTHIFGLRKKLGDCSETIETIRGVGYRIKIE